MYRNSAEFYYFRKMKFQKLSILAALLLLSAAITGCRKPEAGSGSLEGRVTYSTGEGIVDVAVIYGDSAVYTATGGTYVYDGIPDGLQGISFRKDGYYSTMQQVYIPDGGTVVCNAELELITAGWAVGAEDSGYGTILHTTDAGTSWVRQGNTSSVPRVHLTDVCVFSDMVCWIAGDADTANSATVILHTADGGLSWTNQGASISELPPISIASVISKDGDTVWAAAADTCVILRSTDSGSSWASSNESSGMAYYTGIATMDGYEVWCCGVTTDGHAAIEHTSDGGRNWELISVSGVYSGFIPSDICVTPGPILYLAGDNTTGLIRSDNGGASWVQIAGAGTDMRCIDAHDDTHVWTGGDGGHLWFTSDAFFTVRDIRPAEEIFPGGAITSVAMLRDGRRGALSVKSATGATGSILYTTDGGSVWTGSSMPFNFSIDAVDFAGGNN